MIVLLALSLPLSLVGSCNETAGFDLGRAAFAAPLSSVARAGFDSRRAASYGLILAELVSKKPDTFLDLLAPDVLVLLDQPELTRREGSVAIWQYRSDSCVLDLFLDSRKGTVLHYEMRERRKAVLGDENEIAPSEDEGACFRSLLMCLHPV
ncbi:MAG: hypothetical protein KDJ15_01115 [Alphaproteobacteria bacterium]|nr:hypothetical protein [Alphaproteobacteria bacterium]